MPKKVCRRIREFLSKSYSPENFTINFPPKPKRITEQNAVHFSDEAGKVCRTIRRFLSENYSPENFTINFPPKLERITKQNAIQFSTDARKKSTETRTKFVKNIQNAHTPICSRLTTSGFARWRHSHTSHASHAAKITKYFLHAR
jgi:hypothetical protein